MNPFKRAHRSEMLVRNCVRVSLLPIIAMGVLLCAEEAEFSLKKMEQVAVRLGSEDAREREEASIDLKAAFEKLDHDGNRALMIQLAKKLDEIRKQSRDVEVRTRLTELLAPYPDYFSEPDCVDEKCGIWRAVLPPMITPRLGHAVVRLDDEYVLITGGALCDALSAREKTLSTCEVYNLKTGASHSAASMRVPRRDHGICLLADGHVMVAGGISLQGTVASVEIYDPKKDVWEESSPMAEGRAFFPICAFPDGRVLVAGGAGGSGDLGKKMNGVVLSSSELFDPKARTWQKAEMRHRRANAGIVVLPDGHAMVCGGVSRAATEGFVWPGNRGGDLIEHPQSSVECFDPKSGKWTELAAMPSAHRECRAVLLDAQTVMVQRNPWYAEKENDSELYDIKKDRWSVPRFTTVGDGNAWKSDNPILISPWGSFLQFMDSKRDSVTCWVGGDPRVGLPDRLWRSAPFRGADVLMGSGQLLSIGGEWSGEAVSGVWLWSIKPPRSLSEK